MAQSIDSTICPEQLTTMSDLSNSNGNARPQRKCTRSKRIYEDYEMTKISNPTKTKKRRRRQFKKPLLHVDIASHESEGPSNVSVTQPNNNEVSVVNNLDDSVTQPNNSEVNVENNLDDSVTQPNNSEVNVENILDDSVTEPNDFEINVENILDDSVTEPNDFEINIENILDYNDNNSRRLPSEKQIYEYLFLNTFKYIQADDNDKIFPGYTPQLFLELRNFLVNKSINDFVNRSMGICTFKELSRLYVPETLLSDTIIQQYFNILRNNCNNDILIYDSFFFECLEKFDLDKFKKKYLKDTNVLNYSKMLIPTHIINHWVLIVVEIKEKKILYYDSLNYFNLVHQKIRMLKDLLNQKYVMQLKNYTMDSCFVNVCSGMSPKQENSFDCGIFTCINAMFNIFNKPLNYSQKDIPLFRQKMVYEIAYSKLILTE